MYIHINLVTVSNEAAYINLTHIVLRTVQLFLGKVNLGIWYSHIWYKFKQLYWAIIDSGELTVLVLFEFWPTQREASIFFLVVSEKKLSYNQLLTSNPTTYLIAYLCNALWICSNKIRESCSSMSLRHQFCYSYFSILLSKWRVTQ